MGVPEMAVTGRDGLLRVPVRSGTVLRPASGACFGALGDRLSSQTALGTDFGSISDRFGIDFGLFLVAL